MNKHDIVLISILLFIPLVIFGIFSLTSKDSINNAYVYYDDELVLTIDLTKEETTYYVDGYNGKVKILAGNGKIKVDEENSPRHLCSKQGYISKSYESIVCLPNKVVITLGVDDELDTIVK